jgi:hypothetical protein
MGFPIPAGNAGSDWYLSRVSDKPCFSLTPIALAPAERRASYTRIVRAVVSERVRAELENLMKTVIKDPFIDGLIEQGMAEGESDAVLRVLDARGLKPTAAERERITTCTDLDELRAWITRAVTAQEVSDIFG